MKRSFIAIAVLWSLMISYSTFPAAAQTYSDVRERQLGERNLALGSWGADVFTLQIQLREIGYTLQADGLYGKETKAVVEAFQRDHGLPVTGIVGPMTLERLALVRLKRIETMPYTVQPGDSLWSIARAFETTMEVLIEINELPNRPLRAGEEIKVPALGRHVVKPGDTLWGIAKRYRTTVQAIAELNRISPEQVLKVGTILWLPRGSVILPEM